MNRVLAYLILVLVVSPHPSIGAVDAPNAVEKLRFRYEVELENLRAKYAKRLESLVEEQTKAGKLDVAVQAREELEKIRKEAGRGSTEAPKDEAELTKFLAGSKWHAGKSIKGRDGSTSMSHVLTFQANGIVHKGWGRNRPTWKVKGMKLHYEKKVFGFDDDFTLMTRLSGDEKDPKVWKLGK